MQESKAITSITPSERMVHPQDMKEKTAVKQAMVDIR